MECALVCPDAAIPNSVHDIRDLIVTAMRQLDIAESQREKLRELVPRSPTRCGKSTVTRRRPARSMRSSPRPPRRSKWKTRSVRGHLRGSPTPFRLPGRQDPAVLRRGGEGQARRGRPLLGRRRSVEMHGLPRMHRRLRTACARRARCRTRTCSTRFRRGSSSSPVLSNTPTRYVEGAVGDRGRHQAPDARSPQLLRHHRRSRRLPRLRRSHRDPSGTSTNHAIHDKRRKDEIREIESLIEQLNEKLPTVANTERTRIAANASPTIATLEKHLYLLESGPRGTGRQAQ